MLAAASLLWLLPCIAVAAESDPGVSDSLRLSAELFELGNDTRDPLLMLAAARLRQRVLPLEAVDKSPGWLSWRAMLEAARSVSPGDTDVARLAARIEGETLRGTVSGPMISTLRIEENGSYRATRRFRGGEHGVVYLEAAPQAALTLDIVDRGGRRLCTQAASRGRALCRWAMAEDGDVSIRIGSETGAADILLVIN